MLPARRSYSVDDEWPFTKLPMTGVEKPFSTFPFTTLYLNKPPQQYYIHFRGHQLSNLLNSQDIKVDENGILPSQES
jgi:hypothetical protein